MSYLFQEIERTLVDWLEAQGLVAVLDGTGNWRLDIPGGEISISELACALQERVSLAIERERRQ